MAASAALHRVWSRANVDAGTGGGRIGVEATGLVLDGAWNGPDGFYAKAGLSATHYLIGTRSEDRAVGGLAGGVEARGSQVRIEAGRQLALAGGLDVVPHTWVKRSALSVDDFTDAVGSRVSVSDTARITGGVGMTARAERRTGAGMLALQGSVDLAHALDGASTVTDVSGARLTSEAEETELRLALAGVYRQGHFSLAAEASMNGSNPGDVRGAVGLRLSAQF